MFFSLEKITNTKLTLLVWISGLDFCLVVFRLIDEVGVIDICWLEIFDVSQEEMTWWWCVTSVVSTGEDDKATTAVDFDNWSQWGILSCLVGSELVIWSFERILVVRLYFRV